MVAEILEAGWNRAWGLLADRTDAALNEPLEFSWLLQLRRRSGIEQDM